MAENELRMTQNLQFSRGPFPK